MAFHIEYTEEAASHLRGMSAADAKTAISAIDEQLIHQPNIETRNRKPLRPNPIAPWELRVGELRVFYDFDETEEVVVVVAVGVKEHNVLRIGGEEIEL